LPVEQSRQVLEWFGCASWLLHVASSIIGI
jgi:hypothetical protein